MDHDHPINCQVRRFEEVSYYLFPSRRHPQHLRGNPFGGIQMESQTM